LTYPQSIKAATLMLNRQRSVANSASACCKTASLSLSLNLFFTQFHMCLFRPLSPHFLPKLTNPKQRLHCPMQPLRQKCNHRVVKWWSFRTHSRRRRASYPSLRYAFDSGRRRPLFLRIVGCCSLARHGVAIMGERESSG
jgi:hypothetical protein